MKLWPFRKKPQAPAAVSEEVNSTLTADPQGQGMIEPAIVVENNGAARHEEPSKEDERPVDLARLVSDEERAALLDMPAAPAEGQLSETAAVMPSAEAEEHTDGKRSLRQKLASKFASVSEMAHSRPEGLPVRVLMGYLPEVSYRDAKEYAQGIAEKHFEQMGLAFFEAYEYENGYVFEAHEGGPGKAYAPEIIKHFESLGPYVTGELNSVVLRTATRLVEVQRMREGLAAIILPESAEVPVSDWLRGTKSMTPGLNRRTGFFYAGAAVMASGVLALIVSGTVFRLQPYDPAPPQPVETVSADKLPLTQWSRLQSLPPNSYVKALKFQNDRWEAPEIVTAPEPAPTEPNKGQ